MEHRAWVGSDYKKLGIDGQCLAIVGYSHWTDDVTFEGTEASIRCIRCVMSGEWKINFFTQIRNYFGYETHDSFWQRVMFFNYLPECVGGGDERFNHGTQEQINRAKDRFLRLIQKELPDKVLVFTSRRWAFPFDAETLQKLGSRFGDFSWLRYSFDGHLIPIFFCGIRKVPAVS